MYEPFIEDDGDRIIEDHEPLHAAPQKPLARNLQWADPVITPSGHQATIVEWDEQGFCLVTYRDQHVEKPGGGFTAKQEWFKPNELKYDYSRQRKGKV